MNGINGCKMCKDRTFVIHDIILSLEIRVLVAEILVANKLNVFVFTVLIVNLLRRPNAITPLL